MAKRLKLVEGMRALTDSQFMDSTCVSDEWASTLEDRVFDGYYDNREPIYTVHHVMRHANNIRSYREDGTFSSRSTVGHFYIYESKNGIRYLFHRNKLSLFINKLS